MSSTMIRITLALLLAGAVSFWGSSEASACSRFAYTGITVESVLPRDGGVAPPNTRIWIASESNSDSYSVPRDLADYTLHRDAVQLSFTVSTLYVAGEITTELWSLDPDEDLQPGDEIAVHYQDELVSEFRIEGEYLLAAPAAPVLRSLDVLGSMFGALSCGEPSEARVTIVTAQPLILLLDEGNGNSGTSALAVGSGFTARAIDLPPGAADLSMVVMDLAGNRSAVVPLPAVSVPSEVTGCSLSGARGGTSAWLFFVVLLVLRRRSSLRSLH